VCGVVEIHARNTPFIVFSGYPRQDFGLPELHDVPWFEKPGNAEEILRSLTNLLAARAYHQQPGYVR
jgi:hypothetical protein